MFVLKDRNAVPQFFLNGDNTIVLGQLKDFTLDVEINVQGMLKNLYL